MTAAMSPQLASLSARTAVLLAFVLVGCATTASVGDTDLGPDPVAEPAQASLPAPSTPSNTTGDAGKGTGKDGGAVPAKDAGSKPDAAPPPPPPPPPPQICINEAGAPWTVQTECGCDKDCTTGLVCAQVGGLVSPWCCAPVATACNDANDCCGQLLCVSGKCQ